jgi:hypothetical protein
VSPNRRIKTKRRLRRRSQIRNIAGVYAEALCLSALDLSVPSALSRQQISKAVAAVLVQCGGPAGVTSDFAFEYGEHPDLTVARMRQALAVVRRRHLRGRR